MSEVVRADHLTSFFVADGGGPDNRAGEGNYSGALWSHVVGRSEPVRIDGFVGITSAQLLDAITRTIPEVAETPSTRSLTSACRPPAAGCRSRVEVYTSFPAMT
jgi:hypothetical protein